MDKEKIKESAEEIFDHLNRVIAEHTSDLPLPPEEKGQPPESADPPFPLPPEVDNTQYGKHYYEECAKSPMCKAKLVAEYRHNAAKEPGSNEDSQ